MKPSLGSSWMLRTAVSCVLAGTAGAALADAEGERTALAEVVVTATKQSDTIDATAAAITAVTSDALGPGGIQEIRDLALAVPNLSVGDQFGVNRTFIRGIGMTSIDLGADGAVAFLQDGSMIPRPSAQLAGFFDLEQVEVLRGPQGTLYGRGATAGVVNMVTRKPSEVADGYLRVTGGNYSAYTLEGAVGGPISGDSVMGRLAVKIDKRDGYGTNLFTGNDVDDRDYYAVRGSLRFRPSDAVDVTLVADYFSEDDNNYAFHYFGPTTVPDASLPYNLLNGQTIFDYYAALGRPVNQRNIWSDQDAINDRDGTAITAIVDWSINDVWTLKSITAYRDFNRFQRDDLDVSEVWMFGRNDYTEESTSWGQDFTLSGSTGNIEWLAGANYFNEDLFGEVRVPLINLGLLFGLPANTFDNGNYLQQGDVKIDAFGLFVQGKYGFTDQLALTLGARYNYEKRKGTGAFIFDALGANIPTDKQKSWDSVTPKLLLEYTTASDALLYGQITKGFKSGVINVGSQNDVINPEEVWAYEVGLKQPFADGRASLRAAAFYYDYTDLQVGFVNAQSVVETVNAASAENTGVEFELIGLITPELTGSLSATWLNAEYTEFLTGDYRQGFQIVSLKGNKLQNAPEYTVRGALDYRHRLAGGGSVFGNIEAAYQDKVYFTEFNNDDAVQDAYGIVNLALGYEGADGHWSAMGWVRNATDELVFSNNIITAPLYGNVRVGSLLPPRTYGLTLSYNF